MRSRAAGYMALSALGFSVMAVGVKLAARELLAIEPEKTYLVIEHEYPPARIQDKAALAPVLAGSLAFTRAIDEAAAAMYALQHEVLRSQGIPIQGFGREPFRS